MLTNEVGLFSSREMINNSRSNTKILLVLTKTYNDLDDAYYTRYVRYIFFVFCY